MKTLIVRTSRTASGVGAPIVAFYTDNAMRPPPPSSNLGGEAVGDVVFEDRILRVPSFARELAGDLTSLSPGTGAGVLELANSDGALDSARAHVWRDIKVWLWDMDWPLASAVFLFAADCGRSEHLVSTSRPARVVIPLIDAMARLDRPLQGNQYLGTNNGTTILYEGEPGGLQSRPKPWLIGDMNAAQGGVDGPAPQLAGVQVNGTRRTWQLHDGAIETGVEVFDRGVASGLANDGNYSGAAFDARVLPAASFCTDIARGLVKVTDGLIGPMTFGARRTTALPITGANATPGRGVADVLALAATSGGAKAVLPHDPAQIVAALGLAAPCGWWFEDVVSVREALTPFTRAAGGVIVAQRAGSFAAIALAPPKVVPDITIWAEDVVNFEADAIAPVPVGEVRIGWSRVWTPMSGQDLAPSLRGTDQAARLAQGWRYSVTVDANAKARASDWRVMTVETALRNLAGANALGVRLLALFGLRPDGQARRVWKVVVEANSANLAVDLGATIRLVYPSAQLDEPMILLGEQLCTPRRDLMTWSLWA
jgi:hypothetical protein